jgi:hypothetical protein
MSRTKKFCHWGVVLPEHCNQITTKSMKDYKATQKFLTERSLPYFTFCAKMEKPVKTHIRHLPGNTSSEDTTAAFQ